MTQWYSDLKAEMRSIKNTSTRLFDDRGMYINCQRLFYSYYQSIANEILIGGVDCQKFREFMETEMNGQVKNKHYKRVTAKKSIYLASIYVFSDELIIEQQNEQSVCIYFTNNTATLANELENKLMTFKTREKSDPKLHLLTTGPMGYELTPIPNKKPKLDLKLNYNNDLLPFHTRIIEIIKKKERSGLVLFHGIPGSGKSTYLRFLISQIKKKKVIFLSPKLAGSLDAPELTSMLIENPNAIIIIEDAEELIISRELGHDNGISMLLNLTDGLLGENLSIQVICTFNTNIGNIDNALLRKGRLLGSYEFKALAKDKVRILLEKLGNNSVDIEEDMTLAEIYHYREQASQINKETTSIGFF